MEVRQTGVELTASPGQQGVGQSAHGAPVGIGRIERNGVDAAPIVKIGMGPGGALAEFEFHAKEGVEDFRAEIGKDLRQGIAQILPIHGVGQRAIGDVLDVHPPFPRRRMGLGRRPWI